MSRYPSPTTGAASLIDTIYVIGLTPNAPFQPRGPPLHLLPDAKHPATSLRPPVRRVLSPAMWRAGYLHPRIGCSSIATNNLGNQIGDPREVQFTVKMEF